MSRTLRDVSNVIVVEVDRNPAGYAAFRHERPGVLWCDWVVVEPQYRNLGIGAMLMTAVESIAAHRGYSNVMLAVLKVNHRAIRFYLGHGYEQIGEEESKLHLQKPVSRPAGIIPAIPTAPGSGLSRVWDRLLYWWLVD